MKEALYEKSITWAKKKGFSDIKANCEGYEAPNNIKQVRDDSVIIPDITASNYGHKSYIEIALKNDDKQSTISKWKLLGTLAARKGGKLYLMAGRGHKAFTDDIVKDYNLINTQVVSI